MAGDSLSLNEVLRKVAKKYGDDVMKMGVDDLTSYGTLSLGSPSLDFCLYNSFPERRIIEFCGAEGSGKTSLAYLVAASYQRKEIQRDPNNPRKILFVDLECGADPYWAGLMGYNMNDSVIQTCRLMPEDMSAEAVLQIVIDSIKSGEIGLVILDSLNMLVPQQVQEEGLDKKSMGGIGFVLGDFVRRITGILVKYNCTLIGINQLRENIGGYGNPLTTSGGRGWKHGCAVRLMLKKGDFFDEDGNVLTSSAESPAGYVLQAAVLKTKVCKWNRKLGTTHISYTRGVDIMQDTIEVAIQLGLIDNSTQGTFKLINLDTGEIVTDASGAEIKIRGKRNIRPYFENNSAEWNKLYNKVYEKISQKDDPNIVAFEKMLSVSNAELSKQFNIDFDREANDT